MQWIDESVFYAWTRSYYFEELRRFDGYTLPQANPATLPFLPREFYGHPATMNPYLSMWLWKRYVASQNVVVEPMCGVGGTAV